ncbi:MAG: DUF2807 domain-containing protein [Bacteroidales bacterium]|nr:DUF2807 domain-containing protein [Bacteroidales bacterium]
MNTLKSTLLAIALFIAGFLNAQHEEVIVLDKGNYTGVRVNAGLNINLVQSDSNKVTVSPKDFKIEKLKLILENDVLNIESRGVGDEVQIYVYSPRFDMIEANGASNVSTDGIIKGYKLLIKNSGASDVKGEFDYRIMEIESSGASDVKLEGIVDTFYINISGAGDVKAFPVKNLVAYVDASGASDVQLNTDSLLVANLSGTSSVKFQKEPAHKEINSSGFSETEVPKSVWVEANETDITVEENEDTTKITLNGNQIIVIEKDGETKVLKKKIEPTKSKKRSKFRGNWTGVELGINGYVTPDYEINMPSEYAYLDLNYPKSINFNINFFQQSVPIIKNKFGLVTGMGVQWYNYRFSNVSTILTSDSGKIGGYYNQTVGRSYVKSKLTSTYLVVPLLLEFQTNKNHETNSFHLSAGVIGGVRLATHTKQVYSFDGSGKNKPKIWDEFHMHPFRLDATMRIGWGPINLYANYGITTMFRKDRGPELYPFSIGFIFPMG